MEYFFKQLKKFRDASALDARKKDDIRAELVSYMRATRAVREQDLARHSIGKRSATLTNTKFSMKLIRFAAPIAILALLGGGTSFAAASALPGDALYPVKIGVNEKVEAAFQFSAEAKAEHDARLAERRLSEADELAVEGRLNAEASAKVQESFQEFADRVEARIEALRESGDDAAADAVSARFEAALQAHARALAALQARFDTNDDADDDDDSDEVGKLGIPVRAVLRAIQNGSLNVGASSSLSARAEFAADLRIAAATEEIADAREHLAKNSAQLGAEVSAKADAELDAADALLIQAQAKADAKAYVDAIMLANQAVRTAHQVSVLLYLQAKVSANTDVDSASDRSLGQSSLDLFSNSGHGSDDDQDDDDDNGGIRIDL